MTTHTPYHSLERFTHTANVWLGDVAAEFDTDDHDFVFRVTRAWLHAVRDLLPTTEAVLFSAQLPELLRGVYFENWRPGPPAHPDRTEFVASVAKSARITPAEVPKVLWAVSSAWSARLSLDKMLGAVAEDIRFLLRP